MYSDNRDDEVHSNVKSIIQEYLVVCSRKNIIQLLTEYIKAIITFCAFRCSCYPIRKMYTNIIAVGYIFLFINYELDVVIIIYLPIFIYIIIIILWTFTKHPFNLQEYIYIYFKRYKAINLNVKDLK